MKAFMTVILSFLSLSVAFAQLPYLPTVAYPPDDDFISVTTWNGCMYIIVDISFPSGESISGPFLIDTGAQKSVLFEQSRPVYRKKDLRSIEGLKAKYVFASEGKISTLRFTDLVLQLNENPPRSHVILDGKEEALIGVLGADVLLQRSFYFSLTKAEIGWPSSPPFAVTDTFPEIATFSAYTAYDKERWATGIWLRPDMRYTGLTPYGTKEYLIDTASYQINTTFPTFAQRLPDIFNRAFTLRTQKGEAPFRGMVILPDYRLGEATYQGILFGGGYFPGAAPAVLGTQVLARFDWWLEINPKQKVFTLKYGNARASMVSDEAYAAFIDAIDPPKAFFYPRTSGFTTGPDGCVDQVFYNGGAQIEPRVEIGDRLISHDGLSVEPNFTGTFSGGILFFERPDGSTYSIEPICVTMDGYQQGISQ